MMLSQSIALAALAVASVNAEIFDAAHKFAPAIVKAAVTTKANKVYLRNVKTGKYLAYTRDNDTPDLTFSNHPYAVDVSKIEGNKYAFGFADNRYCLSSAWNFTLGLNEYSTLYACCGDRDTCDNGSEEFGPLREAKQQLLLVPVGESAVSTMVKAIVKSGIDLLKRDGGFVPALAGDSFSAAQLAKKHLLRRMTKRDRESRADFEKRCAKHKALALAAGGDDASSAASDDSEPDAEEKETAAPAKKVDHKALAAKLRAQKAQEAADAAAAQAAKEKSDAAKEAAAEKAKEAAQEKAKEAAQEKADAAKKAAAAKSKAQAEKEDNSKSSGSSGHKDSNVIARVHMVAVDHLTDMLTRSLSCQLIMGAGNYMSVRLDVLDDNDACQQWDVIRA